MKATVIMAHPWQGSFNRVIYDTVIKSYQNKGAEVTAIDLYAENFDPVMRASQLALFGKGETDDKMVLGYQQTLAETDEAVFIFPVWWFDMPAMLKGFLDKVLLKDFAYLQLPTGLKGLLTNIKKTTVITTSESPTWFIKYLKGNPIVKTFIKGTLSTVGMKHAKWINLDKTSTGSDEHRKAFLQKIKDEII